MAGTIPHPVPFGPTPHKLVAILRAVAGLALFVAILTTALAVGGALGEGDHRQILVAAVLAIASWPLGFLFLAIATGLRLLQLIEWRLGLR
jgi:hypothetical protein